MKFPRNAPIFRGPLDAAPYAAVFFLLIIFLLLSMLVYTPGVPLRLPLADNLPGTDKATVAVAIDAHGRIFYENQAIEEAQLEAKLRLAGKAAADPKSLTLLIQADQAVTYQMLMRLTLIARQAGINEAWLATMPRPMAP